MELKKILSGVQGVNASEVPSLEITHIAYDSRKINQGALFVAMQGIQSDGHHFISQAIEKGAIAVLCEERGLRQEERRVPVFCVKDSRRTLSQLASNFYLAPTKTMQVIGVTGTNGKTTISYLVEAILQKAGFSPSVIGTVNFRHQNKIFPASHTTPESLDLESFIAARKQEGSDSVVMEVSSHAIDQHRVDDIQFDVAIFTNLTPDHLDYHKDLDSYFEAKAELFRNILPKSSKKEKTAILNLDDVWVSRLKNEIQTPSLGISLHSSKADLYPLSKKISMHGIEAEIQTPQGKLNLKSSLMGEFNLFNLMSAIAAGLALKIPLKIIEEALHQFCTVPGRLERVENEKGIHVFVDYAHTPDALKNVLQTLRPLLTPHSSLFTVFGCGGDRDRTKRPLMGAEVARFSDFAVLTSDNPRTENPITILQEVRPGLESLGWEENKKFWVEVDRRKGIGLAISKAQAGDIVLIAGKGHENYQILGKEKIHFDDREVAREFLI